MKFEAIKTSAKKLYAQSLANWGSNFLGGSGLAGQGTAANFAALMPFIRAGEAEREELHAFAQTFGRSEKDWLASAANGSGFHAAWSQVVLQAREAGLALIENWDVRQVGRLIELFPDAVPARYRGKPLQAFQEDSDDSPWIVEPAATPV